MNNPMNSQTSTRLMRLPAVLEKVGLSKTEWYRLLKAGSAPAPVALAARVRAWRESDIDTWINSLAQADLNSAGGANAEA